MWRKVLIQMSQDRAMPSGSKPGTEYRLSISSNPGSRRSSLAGNDSFSGNNSINDNRNGSEIERNVLQEYLVPQIRELSDSVITMESNFTRLNQIHSNLVDLNESFGSLLYGMICNSACIDFPGIPDDTYRENQIMNRLRNLAKEKQYLLHEIANVKNEKHETPSQKKQFSEPLFSTNQAKRNSSKPTVNRRQILQQSNGEQLQEEYIDDDTNSEASFVLNPQLDEKLISNSNKVKIQNNPKSKLRRKSILHTIRNSITGDGGENANKSTKTDNLQNLKIGNNADRHSLAGGATRLVYNIPSNQRNVSSNGISHYSTKVVKRKLPRKTTELSKRPPFR